MHGPALWEQIWAIVAVIIAVMAAAAFATWRVLGYIAAEKKTLQDKFDKEVTTLEARLAVLERFQAGTEVVLGHIEDFREESREQYKQLRTERKSDMAAIHTRLDAVHNDARMAIATRKKTEEEDDRG